MRLREVGEFELIERMARIFNREGVGLANAGPAPSRLCMGIGDDAAVWQPTPGSYTIATADAMVEGVHFTAGTTDWYDLGWKAMASNISDIAGMGGQPRYALAVLGARGDREVEDILELCRGMADIASRFGTSIVGGDTVSSALTTLSITLIGETKADASGSRPAFLSRSTARPGYDIAVSGNLGSSAGGLELLLGSGGKVPERFAALAGAHRRPLPRVAEGQGLLEAGVPCGMDMSDGLSQDLTRICLASGVAAVVEAQALPMDPLLREAFGDRATDLAISGGEDYELLCLAPRETMARAVQLLLELGTTLTVVGRAVEADPGRPPVLVSRGDGTLLPPRRIGWEHFSAGGDAGAS